MVEKATILFIFIAALRHGLGRPAESILQNATFAFECGERAVGFYADVEHRCQVFHMCDEDGRRIPYACANETSFNQQYRICDWDYNFQCEDAPNWYYLNELTYVTDPPRQLEDSTQI